MYTQSTYVWLAIIALSLSAVAESAQAGACSAPINARQSAQNQRLAGGLASGELTIVETAQLATRQAHIERVEQRYRRNDGRLGPAERCDLNNRLNSASRQIYRNKHDRQRWR